jgi:transmembrane sensor
MTTSDSSESTVAVSDHGIVDFDPVRAEAYAWIAQFASGDMTSIDVQRMKAWYTKSPAHAAAYSEARHVWRSLGPIASASIAESALEGDEKAPPTRANHRSLIGRRAFLGAALAASAAYLVVRPPANMWPSFAELTADVRTGVGEQRQLSVADRVSLELNTRTSILVGSQPADRTNIEVISGEAAISTVPASPPLNVTVGHVHVAAFDADFNVRCDDSRVSISCIRGELIVDRGGPKSTLFAQQQVTYGTGGTRAIATIKPDIVTAWRHGMLIFDGTPVAQVIDEINRYRPGRIMLASDTIGRRLLSARLRIAEVDKIVGQIVHIFGAKATALPGGIVVLT